MPLQPRQGGGERQGGIEEGVEGGREPGLEGGGEGWRERDEKRVGGMQGGMARGREGWKDEKRDGPAWPVHHPNTETHKNRHPDRKSTRLNSSH